MLFINSTVFIECLNECGNDTHPSMPDCADCMNDNSIVIGNRVRGIAQTRRNFTNFNTSY